MENFRDIISRVDNKGDGSNEFREHFWKTVFDSLQNLKEEELRFIDKDFIAKFLLASLQRYGCSNPDNIKIILTRYASQLNERFMVYSMMHSFFSVPFIAQDVHLLLTSGCLDHIISYKDEFTRVLDSMDLTLEFAEQDFAICLTKYGLYSPGKIDLKGVTKCVDLFFHAWTYIHKALVVGEPLLNLISEFFLYISQKHPKFPAKRPKRHVVFILRIIQAINLKLENDPRTEKYVNCIKLFYRIIPEPYIPCDDIKDLLLFLLQSENCTERIIQTCLATYVELFGEDNTASYTPRSLKHLARCVIRNEIIKSSKTVQTAVHHLCLPETLKELLVGASE